jgi:hypothetical protein
MRKGIKCFVLVGFAAAAFVLPTAALASGTVPYKGIDVGSWAIGTEHCDGSFVINTSGVAIINTGVATDVFRYTYSSHECATGAVTYAGVFTLTAANGGTIVGSYAGTVRVDAAGNAFYEQTNTITGGSGRFAGASGWFHVSGIAPASGVDVQRAQGAISIRTA